MRLTNIQYNRIIALEWILCFFAGYGMALSVLMYEVRHSVETEIEDNIMLTYNLVCTSKCFSDK